MHKKLLIILAVAALSLPSSCLRRTADAVPRPPVPADNSYMDLKPNGRLRIVLPIVAPGGSKFATDPVQSSGNTLVLSAKNLIGYQVSNYAIEGRADGKVTLRFASARITKGGKTLPEPAEPALPFPLPSKSRHVRLIYLIRSSQVDHNMAIAASRNLAALDSFTSLLKVNPDVCKSDGKIFCTWVPAGIAVRPE